VGDWWLSFSIRKEENTKRVKPMTGKTAGFDFGLKHFLTGNDGQKIDSPQYLFHSINELRKKSRNLSKKVKGSNSRKKAKIELARFHRRISNLRSDFHWKLANQLVSEYDTICLETLNTKAMQQMWGRKISDLAFAEFVKTLSVECKKHNRKLVQINQWEATSKTCSHCGHKKKEMPLNIRKWTCPECGEVHYRDINAARNILRVGTSALGRGSVRPTP
jgi:putative transposase